MPKQRPNIYIGQIDSLGFVTIMERREHSNFVWYSPRRLRLRVNDGLEFRIARDLDEARLLRRHWIANRKSAGLTVKGVRGFSEEMFHELNTDRFNVPVPLRTREEVDTTYDQNRGWIMIQKYYRSVWDVVFGREFGNVTLGDVGRAVRNGTIFEVFPRRDAPPL